MKHKIPFLNESLYVTTEKGSLAFWDGQVIAWYGRTAYQPRTEQHPTQPGSYTLHETPPHSNTVSHRADLYDIEPKNDTTEVTFEDFLRTGWELNGNTLDHTNYPSMPALVIDIEQLAKKFPNDPNQASEHVQEQVDTFLDQQHQNWTKIVQEQNHLAKEWATQALKTAHRMHQDGHTSWDLSTATTSDPTTTKYGLNNISIPIINNETEHQDWGVLWPDNDGENNTPPECVYVLPFDGDEGDGYTLTLEDIEK